MAPSRTVDTGPEFGPHVLREYALLADGERGALVGPHGDIAWMCAPRWDSDAVFSTLIGGAGTYAVTPSDPRHVWGGFYEPGTLIWHSRWATSSTVIECREALAFPGDPARVVLLRRVQARDGESRVRVLLDPRAGFGKHTSGHLSAHDGVWTGRSGPLRWRWVGGANARPIRHSPGRGAVLVLDLEVPPGGHHDLVLELSDEPLPPPAPDAETLWQATEAAWKRGRPRLADTAAPRDAHQAYAVLRGLTSAARRHGGRRHNGPAGARRGRDELRLPLRVDPGPVLRRHRRGQRRSHRTA